MKNIKVINYYKNASKSITFNLKKSLYNFPNEKQALYCSGCKLENMVDRYKKKGVSHVI